MILDLISFHKNSSPNIVMTACTTISNLTTFDYVNADANDDGFAYNSKTGIVSTDVHENSQLFYQTGICEIMVNNC